MDAPTFYFNLIFASMAIAAIFGGFFAFRYQVTNSYVDTRKQLIRQLLECEIIENEMIYLEIQELGKLNNEYMRLPNKTNEALAKQKLCILEKIKSDKLSIRESVTQFIDDIYTFRNGRNFLVKWGIRCSWMWGIFSFLCLCASTTSYCASRSGSSFSNTSLIGDILWSVSKGKTLPTFVAIFVLLSLGTLMLVVHSIKAWKRE